MITANKVLYTNKVRQRETDKPYYKYRVSNGLCVRCGDEPARKMSRVGIECAKKLKNDASARKVKLKSLGLCSYCGIRPLVNMASCAECTVKLRTSAKTSKATIRAMTFERYGGYICNCCQETNNLALSIDHINNNGAEERRLLNSRGHVISGDNFYYRLRDLGYPDGYQVLCMNCQFIKQKSGGICTHQTTKVELDTILSYYHLDFLQQVHFEQPAL